MTAPKATPKNIQTVREMWRHEDGLVNSRVTWLALFNSIFVGAFAAAWGTSGAHPLLVGICVFGIVVSVSAGVSLYFSQMAMSQLGDWWNRWVHEAANDDPTPSLTGYKHAGAFDKLVWWLLPWTVLPVVFSLGWCMLLGYVLS